MSGKVSYGEGLEPDGTSQGVWWVKTLHEVGHSIVWFDTEAEAKIRCEKLSKEFIGEK